MGYAWEFMGYVWVTPGLLKTGFVQILYRVLRCAYGCPLGFYGVPTGFLWVPQQHQNVGQICSGLDWQWFFHSKIWKYVNKVEQKWKIWTKWKNMKNNIKNISKKIKNIPKYLKIISQKISKYLKISLNFSNVVFRTWFCETGFCIANFSGP